MNRLEELIPMYGRHDEDYKNFKKVCDAEKEEIKMLMEQDSIDSLSAGGYKVTRSVSTRESLDTERLMEYIKAIWSDKMGSMTCPYIEYRPVLNMEAFEKALYEGKFTDEEMAEMDRFRTANEVVTLRCTKAKTKKED